MFILHSSNKSENLLAHLTVVLDSIPLSSPFSEELFLIQSQGIERWLVQQLTQHFNVFANYRFLSPIKFLAKVSESLLNGVTDTAFDQQVLLWRFDALLRDIDDEDFLPLRQFLSGENLDLKRYQLAQQLTYIFDQYQLLRPDMLNAWQQGQTLYHNVNERWQRLLWQRLTAEIASPHRGEVWQQAINILQQAEHGTFADSLPERILVFGVNTMPPLLLAYLQALSSHTDVHLFLLNPVQGYWLDLPTKRLQAELKEFVGHPLLIRLAQQGREFQQLLLEQVEFQFEPSSFESQAAETNLNILQNDILDNALNQTELRFDHSISIHACHSRLREVQVLKNQLLATLEANHDIELRDIMVMAPDIQQYAPFISAVFSDIAHTISDRSIKQTNPAINALLKFLDISQSRFGWQDVLDLLEQPLVFVNFDLDETDISLIRYWLTDCQVRWGKDADHRQSLGLPALTQNTWRAVLDRLFMGVAVGENDGFVHDILPYPHLEGGASLALGGLNDFLQLLFKASDELKYARSIHDWQSLFVGYSNALLGVGFSPDRQLVNEVFNDMLAFNQVHQYPVSLAVMIAWLQDRISEVKTSSGFLRGQLSFCSMLPMRSIPFQVIALLGMNEGEFPRIDRRPRFDLLMQQPRLGDRSRRADDRYQFLEALLSARRQCIITYIGLSSRDNHEIPPSVVLSELLEVLADNYKLTDIVTYHPLHAFNAKNFSDDARLFSYSASDYATACFLQSKQPELAPWWQGKINSEQLEIISIDELVKFYQHPQKYFLQQQLGVRLPVLPSMMGDSEPFVLDNLSIYHIQQYWLAEMLDGKTLSVTKLQAQGLWPLGALGEIVWHQYYSALHSFVETLHAKQLGARVPATAIDMQIGAYRIIGKLDHSYENGSLYYRYAKLKGKDFVFAWLHHLLMNCVQPQTTHLLSTDYDLSFKPEIATPDILLSLIALFQLGKSQPDVFFTEAAFCYVQQKKPESARDAVIKQLQEHVEKGFEPEIARLFGGLDVADLISDSFINSCKTLIYPAWSGSHEE